MERTDRIEDKIKKLLALSQSSNPNEAKAALLKAQDLMLKYNLSVDYKKEKIEICTESVTVKHTKYYLKMAALISENFRTKTWYSPDKIIFMGYRDDAVASRYCLEYLIEESTECFSQYLYEQSDNLSNEPKSYLKYIHRQWMNGFVNGIQDAFNERKNDPQYELMLITPTDVLAEYEKKDLRSAKLSDSQVHNQDVYEAGYTDGKEALDKRSISGECD